MSTTITFAHVLTLASIDQAHKHSLDQKGDLIGKRSCLRNLAGWVVYIITLGFVARNGPLDQVTEKMIQATQSALRGEKFTAQSKAATLKALRNLKIIIKQNSGSKGSKLELLINQVAQATLRTTTAAALEKEVANATICDQALGPAVKGSWRAGPGSDEKEQTLAAYQTRPDLEAIRKRRILQIHSLGQFSAVQLKILRIVSDYLAAVHGVTMQLAEDAISIDALKKRHIEWLLQQPHGYDRVAYKPVLELFFSGKPFVREGQYDYRILMSMISSQLHPGNGETSTLGFTSEDIYADKMNFIFGAASALGGATGLFSVYRLGNPETDQKEWQLCLKRLMKLASHEFAHMRGLEHCTTHSCNMQGGNSMAEMDELPLTFCAKDMAKICSAAGRSLKAGYQQQLAFFENFTEMYRVQCDFSIEVRSLQARLTCL